MLASTVVTLGSQNNTPGWGSVPPSKPDNSMIILDEVATTNAVVVQTPKSNLLELVPDTEFKHEVVKEVSESRF